MPTVNWTPGNRRAKRELEDPYEGIPAHLEQPLWSWFQGGFEAFFGDPDERVKMLAIDLRIAVPAGTLAQKIVLFRAACKQDHEFLLDLVEAMLERYKWDTGRALDLRDLLTEANSAYAVNETWDGLEQRVVPGVKELIREVADSAHDSPGDHLTSAWSEAYGRNADPVKAYSEAIKAVEASLALRISPQNGKQTLGSMIRDVSAKPTKWKFAIPDGSTSHVEIVVQMMRMLWEGQTSRHGGLDSTRDETLEEARAALHIAASLVQFGTSGAFDLA
jgi:hypothetical protein